MDNLFKKITIDYYRSANISALQRTQPRVVEMYELELYTTSGNISIVNNEKINQKKGNILIARPGDVRCSINHFECYYAHFMCYDEEIVKNLELLPTVFSTENTDSLSEIFKNLIRAKKLFGMSKRLYIQGKLMELISLIEFENSQKYVGKYKSYVGDVEEACRFAAENFEQPIQLCDMALNVNLSAGFFHKVFKEIKGITPTEYITKIRLEAAKDMLKRTNISLSEIAVSCGFSSQSYFNYVFKKYTNLTPKSFRDKNQVVI